MKLKKLTRFVFKLLNKPLEIRKNEEKLLFTSLDQNLKLTKFMNFKRNFFCPTVT